MLRASEMRREHNAPQTATVAELFLLGSPPACSMAPTLRRRRTRAWHTAGRLRRCVALLGSDCMSIFICKACQMRVYQCLQGRVKLPALTV